MKQCLNCCRKHIAKAEAYYAQWLTGYPNDKWFCIGELCHAEEHVLSTYPSFAAEIGTARKEIEFDGSVDLSLLMDSACSLTVFPSEILLDE